MSSSQRFPWPTMPFTRDIHSGCAINTSIIIKAKPYPDLSKDLIIDLKSEKDIALHLTIPVNKQGNISINSRLNGNYSSEIEKPIFLGSNVPFVLHIRMNTHAAEIYKDNVHITDYIHRVDPLEVKTLSIEGPILIEEVVFEPPRGASLDPLPSYEDAFKKSLPASSRPAEGTSSTVTRNPQSVAIGGQPFSYTAPELPPKPKSGNSEKKPPYPEEGPLRVQNVMQGQQGYSTQVAAQLPQPQPLIQSQAESTRPLQPQPFYNPNVAQNMPQGYPGAMGSVYPPATLPQPMVNQVATVPAPQLPTYNVYNPYAERQTTIVQAQPIPETLVYPQQTIIQQPPPFVVQPQIYPSVYGYSYPTVFYEGGYGHHHHGHHHHHHHC